MQIITYPHPTLRQKSLPLRRVNEELRLIVKEMFELMYAAKGIGLAANQVDLPIRLFIINLKGNPSEGEEMVFINPVISSPKGSEEAEEGCLSLPGLYGPVVRPKTVHINAYGMDGKEVSAEVSGLLSRCIQHELDHLDGVLFPDRMSESAKANALEDLDVFETSFESRRATGEVPSDEVIQEQWANWHRKFC
ncbi:MAG: peptide deformylase [Planctomycetaceae bacterium]